MRREHGFTLIELLIVVAIIGIIAAIAIPSLLRARVASNESATIGDIRTVISSQAAYQSANGGWFEGNIGCLAQHGGCIGATPLTTAPTFLDSQVASLSPKSGYARSMAPGAAVPAPDPAVSATSVLTYVYEGTPLNIGQTGVRGLGGDSTGVLCYSSDGTPPSIASGVLDTNAPNCVTLK